MGLRIVIEDTEGARSIFPLSEGEVTIGRTQTNTIQLKERNVSRSHAKLSLRGEEWMIDDLSSYNGVQVNGRLIGGEPTVLRTGDTIRIGDYGLVLRDDADTGPLPALKENRPDAANGSPVMVASSASDLPIISSQEIADIRRGELSAGDGLGTDDDIEAPRKGGKGIMVAAVGVLLLGAGAFFAMKGEEKGQLNAPVVASAAAEKAQKSEALSPAPAGQGQPVEEGVGQELVVDEGEEEILEEEEAAEPAPSRRGKKSSKKRGRTKAKKKATEEAEPSEAPAAAGEAEPTPAPAAEPKNEKDVAPPPPPGAGEGDAKALMADARKASLGGDPSRAYDLASRAYKLGHSSKALQLMGVSACKMKSKAKAKAVHAKMSASKKGALEKVCAAQGVELP